MNTEILFFSAPWCGPCRAMKSTLNESARQELNIRIIDITQDMELAAENKVMNVPTFIKFVDGKEVSRKSGAMTIQNLKDL
jgi:thiol-disulfide isomerase/thioredoxin